MWADSTGPRADSMVVHLVGYWADRKAGYLVLSTAGWTVDTRGFPMVALTVVRGLMTVVQMVDMTAPSTVAKMDSSKRSGKGGGKGKE